MISFIVIGRNEGWKLSKSLQSVCDTIEINEFVNFEIIYVDSDSNDDSIDRAKKFIDVNIFKLSGDLNAGIARNVGANESKGDVLFFIDGDMEIQPEFLKLVYSEEQGLIHDFVSGNYVNYYYDFSDEYLRKRNYKEMKTDSYEKVTGGFFLINKESWDLVGGINERFKISEDVDIGLRLAKKGVFLLRKKEIGVIHHTIDYLDKKRMWKDFMGMNHIYGRSYLYRKNIYNKYMYHRLLRNDYTMLLLVFSVICFIIFSLMDHSFIGYSVVILFLITLIIRGRFSLRFITYLFLRDLTVLLGFFIFHPKKNKFLIEKVK